MPHVLVVDDTATCRHLLAKALEKAGYFVQTACDGIDALRTAEQYAFDLVITDCHMLNMDGITLIRRLRGMRGYADTPVIVMSVDRARRNEGVALGINGWILKPFKPNHLLTFLSQALQQQARSA